MTNLQSELTALKSAAEKMPSPETISFVLNLISKGAPYDQLFFEKLDDSSWLPILEWHGYFSNLPGIKTTGDGRQFYSYHLPLIGLANLASKAPYAVTSVLAKIEPSENPMVGDQLLRCIGLIKEQSCIPVLHPLLGRLADKPNRSSWVWIQELIKNWMQIKAYPDVLIAINSFLTGVFGAASKPSRIEDPWSIQEVDKIALEPLSSEYSLQIATIIFSALARWLARERFERIGELQSDFESYLGDNTSDAIWLEDFRTTSSYRETEATLARRLFLVAEQIMKQGDVLRMKQVDQLLRSNSTGLFNRLRWQLYADFPNLTFEYARRDVLLRLPYLGRTEFTHNFEFAQMLQVFTKQFGNKFISEAESKRFFETVLTGPDDRSGRPVGNDFREWFQGRQLWPILIVLDEDQRRFYLRLQGIGELDLDSYKPGRLGAVHSVEHVAPSEVRNLAVMADDRLWHLLNTWKPSRIGEEPWIQEDFGFLAKSFVELIEKESERFSATKKWWEKLQRPEPFIELLNRAVERLQKKPSEVVQNPTANDWATWFGVAWWIILQPTASEGKNESRSSDWYWSKIVACNFITAAFQTQYPDVIPYVAESGQLLKKLAEDEDSGLKDLNETRLSGWLTTAINTVRGHAIEGILKLALRQKNAKEEISPWIFDFICSRLAKEDESPAIFALLGGNLRLVVYLFGDNLKQVPELLFPRLRPLHRRAAVVAHFGYDRPMTGIIAIYPNLLELGLLTLREIISSKVEEKQQNNPRDFASQLGVHIAFYSWNDAFSDKKIGDTTIDNFFSIARSQTRAEVIGQIAWIFQGVVIKDNEKPIQRVMQIWDRRFVQIGSNIGSGAPLTDYEGELDRFLDWLPCECFPIGWRFDNVIKAIKYLQNMRDLFRVFHALYDWNVNQPERLGMSLQLLAAILEKSSDQLRWSIQSEKISPILARAFSSREPDIRAQAIKCHELLLKLGFFDLLELENLSLESGN